MKAIKTATLGLILLGLMSQTQAQNASPPQKVTVDLLLKILQHPRSFPVEFNFSTKNSKYSQYIVVYNSDKLNLIDGWQIGYSVSESNPNAWELSINTPLTKDNDLKIKEVFPDMRHLADVKNTRDTYEIWEIIDGPLKGVLAWGWREGYENPKVNDWFLFPISTIEFEAQRVSRDWQDKATLPKMLMAITGYGYLFDKQNFCNNENVTCF